MKVLVLDDEPGVRKVVGSILTRAGHEAHVASDADEAMGLLAVAPYDVVLLDYMMPGKDGLWFLEHANLVGGTLAVLMTAHGTTELINRALELGAAGYILKPFSASQLLHQMDFYACKRITGAAPQPESVMVSTAQ